MIGPAARLAAVLVLLAAPLCASAQISWWESDSGALAYRKTSAALAPGLEWSLSVERAGAIETRILYRLGLERSRLRLERDASGALIQEMESRSDGTSTLTRRDTSGRPLVETLTLADGSSRTTSFAYSPEGLLLSATSWALPDTLLWTDSYRYGAAGEPLGLERRDAEGRLFALGSDAASSWLSEGEARSLRIYDARGRLVSTEDVALGGVVKRLTLAYEGEGRSAVRSSETEGKRATERSYDGEGRLLLEAVSASGVAVSSRELSWNAEGRLEIERFRSGPSVTERSFRYAPDGTIAVEEERLDGVLVRRASTEGADTVEELFDAGVLFARVRSREGRVIREELYSAGSLVRSRDFP